MEERHHTQTVVASAAQTDISNMEGFLAEVRGFYKLHKKRRNLGEHKIE
jgi:hypothetical protein